MNSNVGNKMVVGHVPGAPTQLNVVYQFFPQSSQLPSTLVQIPICFDKAVVLKGTSKLKSDEMLAKARPFLIKEGFYVERGKKKNEKITVSSPNNNSPIQQFDVDAMSKDGKIIIEVEAGRGWENKQFLKDLFEACIVPGVEYVVIVVLKIYKDSKGIHPHYDKIKKYFEALYASNRMTIPLKGVLLIGY